MVIRSLCPDCYAKRYPVARNLIREIEVYICRSCGATRLSGKWIRSYSFSDAIEKVVNNLAEKIKPEPPIERVYIYDWTLDTEPDWRTKISLKLHYFYKGFRFETFSSITIRFKPTVCPDCIIKRSREYDTLVQVRGDLGLADMAKIVNEALKGLGEWSSLIEVIETGRGIDVYFSHRGAASRFIRILKRFGVVASVSGVSHETVGFTSSGKIRSRKTIVVRLKGRKTL